MKLYWKYFMPGRSDRMDVVRGCNMDEGGGVRGVNVEGGGRY